MPLQKDVFQECIMSQIYCDDYICSKRKEKVRDSFSQTMKPGKGNSVTKILVPVELPPCGAGITME